MSTPKTLLPLRIPELGPSFGKLVSGTGRDPGGLDLAPVRHVLITRLFDDAGEARRLAGREERAAAIGALARANWLGAWEDAVNRSADVVWNAVNARLAAAARVVRMPEEVLRGMAPAPMERRALVSRIGSAGAGLMHALDEIERRGARALDATSLERADMDAWLDALRTAARRLEDAWIQLEDYVESELQRFDPAVERVSRWRRPLWPVLVGGAVGLAVATWLGLVIGGYIPAPGFLEPLVAAWPG